MSTQHRFVDVRKALNPNRLEEHRDLKLGCGQHRLLANKLVDDVIRLRKDVPDLQIDLGKQVRRKRLQALLEILSFDSLVSQVDGHRAAVPYQVKQSSRPHEAAIDDELR